MIRISTQSMRWNSTLSRALRHSRRLVLALGTLATSSALLSCSAGSESSSDSSANPSNEARPNATELGQSEEALQASLGDSCGYQVTSLYHSRHKQDGFYGLIELKNVSGEKALDFQVLADLHGASPSRCLLANCTAVEGGYLFTPPHLFRFIGLKQGQTYPLPYVSKDDYQEVTPYVISVNGKLCDQVPPSVSLDASGGFFSAAATLTLSATASDNVGLKKVVFLRDGQVIGTDMTAPYSLNLPLSASDNGKHQYTATAYDISGNAATSGSKRALVAIGNQFFGTATTDAADYAGLLAYFNQLTPGNAGKWGTVEATRNVMNWTDLDVAYQFAKANQLPFKLHTLIWGQQQPAWLAGLSAAEQLTEIEEWLTALATRYPDVALIDVVNEPLHAAPSYAAALGGAGTSGWDWVIKSFQLARTHFPNAELLLNEYYVLPLASTTNDYLTIINLLKTRGLIDGIGEQGHFYERAELPVLAANLNALSATGLPIYISELDINFANDARQALRMSELFPLFWSNPSVVGVTHWGYREGNMWRPDAYLLRSDGTERPALTWLKCYRAGGSNCPLPAYVPEARTGNSAGIKLEAEDYDAAQGLLVAGNVVAYTDNGDWLSFDKVAFDNNWNTLSVSYAQGSATATSLTLHLDSLENAPLATINLAPTGDWNTLQNLSLPWAPLSGEHTLLVRFSGGVNLDSFQFSGPTNAGVNLVTNASFESGTTGWGTWNGGALSASTLRAHGGTHSLLVSNRASNAPAAIDLTSVVSRGQNYPVSIWAAIDSTDGGSQAINVTRLVECDGVASYRWLTQVTVPDNDQWLELTGSLDVTDCNVTKVLLFVEGGTADLYLDDVRVTAASAVSNLIPDGSFEAGQGGWFGWGNSGLSVVNSVAHTGQQSLRGAGMQSGAIARDIRSLVSPGKRYQATAWVSVGNLAAGSGAVKFQTAAACDGAGVSYPWLAGATVASGSWQQVTGTVDLSACTGIDQLQLFVGADAGDLYIDDVTLTTLP